MTGTSHAGIEARGLRRSFGSIHAVRDATFDARPGRITGLVGPNGAGKTTLFLLLASLLAPDAGSVRVGGADPVTDPRSVRRVLGWMPDALGTWDSLTARETLTVAARLYGAPRDAARARADELLGEVGLAPLAGAKARVLSRGQKQLLGLARALVHRPTVLLLDEPASGLDPAARIALRHHLRALADAGATILISSHVLAELDEMVDDAVFLAAGATVAAPPPATQLREWRIRGLGGAADPGSLREAVSGLLPGVAVRVDRQDVVAGFAGDEAAASALARLVHAGVPVAEFAPASGRLESAFFELQGGAR
ncbi:ABC transporter ATP-binding protein [Microbacterium sp. ZXX196]|uniref:ABC transporter ATP-binding protein n=1 Tax=Microbacterium sp. ZXX196 TaxID=2609291 RepID=UPI0012B8E498|nr:ABC transporter ATP-binding protein [Microbacterium sp. ZXX196]MTE24199.1 ATP-binding cassette domain-containing protein [Microbacterium sp. ZXX196]